MALSDNIKTYHTFLTREVQIGNLLIGSGNPIFIQSMTNSNTLDTVETVEQCIRLADAGCDIIRITAPAIKEAENLENIKSSLLSKGYNIPIVADIHFNPKAAEIAAKYVEKVRINPGNYVDRNRGKSDWSEIEILEARERIAERLIPLLEICKVHHTAIRIGTNHGSLSERILSMHGNTAKGMVESAMEFVRICHDYGFDNLVLSMKASNAKDMINANLLLVEEMIKEGNYYPIHLGVTEAGNGEEARIKSAAGIGHLLARGIGDTVRVSLAEMPVAEVPVGKKLIDFYGRKPGSVKALFATTNFLTIEGEQAFKELTGVRNPVVSSKFINQADLCFPDAEIDVESKQETYSCDFITLSIDSVDESKAGKLIFNRKYSGSDNEDLLLKTSVDYSLLFYAQKSAGIWIENGKNIDAKGLVDLSLKILQGLGLRYSNAEFVACPSCGRTKFNLFDSFNKVKEKTAHLKGLQIAVMGCIVNGPGEMGDADYGYVGAGPGKVTIYKGGKPELKNIKEELAVEDLIKLIKKNGDWRDC